MAVRTSVKLFAGVSAGYGVLGAITFAHNEDKDVIVAATIGALTGVVIPFVSITSGIVLPMAMMAAPVMNVMNIWFTKCDQTSFTVPMKWSNDI